MYRVKLPNMDAPGAKRKVNFQHLPYFIFMPGSKTARNLCAMYDVDFVPKTGGSRSSTI